jgi:hypothetical protein
MNDKKVAFIPFHAINQFMRNDFRINIIRSTLLSMSQLDREFTAPIDRLTRKHVKVAGFRNSAKAPATVKAVAMVKPFEKHPNLVAAILNAWTASNAELRQQVFDLLTGRLWKLLPVETDRTKLPGFLTRWPDEDDFEVLYEAFTSAHPDADASIDEVSLMVVWLSGRLPVDKISKEEMKEPEIQANTEETEESES